jgi:hypothetical protein
MAGILARIKIEHVQGAEIAYMYEKEILDQIGLNPTEFDTNETFFNIGDKFQLGERSYRVVNIYTKFFNQIHEPHGYGVNIYGIGEQQPYNFQITYEVENA